MPARWRPGWADPGRILWQAAFPGGLARHDYGFWSRQRRFKSFPGSTASSGGFSTWPRIFGFAALLSMPRDRSGPAFDLPVESGTGPHVDTETAVVCVADVLADSRRVVSLEGRATELIRLRASHAQPELLSCICIGALMDMHSIDEPVWADPRDLQEAHEEPDQRRIAVREDNAILPQVWLVLGAL